MDSGTFDVDEIMDRIKDECDKIGTEFDYELHETGFVFIFRRKETEFKTKNKKISKITERENLIFEYLSQNEFITNSIFRDISGVSEATAKRTLAKMTSDGKLLAEGNNLGRKYYLNEE